MANKTKFKPSGPTNYEGLRQEIARQHGDFSDRLRVIAEFALEHPTEMALGTVAEVAERATVQPSAIVRFAKSFGFDGASQMQRLFRDGLLSGHAALGYAERVRKFSPGGASAEGAQLLAEFVEGNTLALQNLAQTVTDEALAGAVNLIDKAEAVYVVGFRRAFPVSSYLAYSLQQAGKRTVFVDGIAGLARQQVQALGPKDLLVAVSYQPYAEETVHAVETAASRGARVLAISDSLVSPIAKPATLTLQVRESEVRAFRSLSASMCLAQALVIGFVFQVSRKEAANTKRRVRTST